MPLDLGQQIGGRSVGLAGRHHPDRRRRSPAFSSDRDGKESDRQYQVSCSRRPSDTYPFPPPPRAAAGMGLGTMKAAAVRRQQQRESSIGRMEADARGVAVLGPCGPIRALVCSGIGVYACRVSLVSNQGPSKRHDTYARIHRLRRARTHNWQKGDQWLLERTESIDWIATEINAVSALLMALAPSHAAPTR